MWSQFVTGYFPLRAAVISAFSNSPAIGWRFKTENCRSKRKLRLHCRRKLGLFMFWDALAVLLARVFLGVTWRGFRHTLE
jgi:hypothetical protein